MCGIAGIFSYHYAAPKVDRKELRIIRDHMAVRGPDGSGEWFSADGRVAFGHRRLAIIDLTENAAQPMSSPDGNLIISFNGEIYNYPALRQQLEHKGHQFRTSSDTEVLLHLYAEKGPAMLQDLRGMFAIALWDQRKQVLFLGRDPFGIKPLYYADDGWTLRFASQVKALLAGGKISRFPEPAGIAGFYLLGSVPEPWTTFQEIRSIPAGSYLLVDSTGPGESVQYFSIARTWTEALQAGIDPVNLQEKVRSALLDSVKHHMVADVPVGAFLSAGIDSGALTGLMSEIHPGPNKLKTITLSFEEFRGSDNNESPSAEQVANLYATDHTTRIVSEQEFHEDLPAILDAMDQPSIDGINTWFVAKAAKEQGLKVAVSGLGGDELFGGYPSFFDVPRWVKKMAVPSRIPLLGDLARMVAEKVIPHTSINPKAAGMIKYGGNWHMAWFLRRGLFMPWELKLVMDKEQAQQGLDRLQLEHTLAGAIIPEPATPYGKVAALEASLYMRNQLLRDADWAGMAHSLEIRVPLVDSILLTTLAPVLQAGNITSKQVLADSPKKSLPPVIISRAKTGFTTPIEKWQQKSEGKQVPGPGDFAQAKNIPWARKWARFVGGKSNFSFEEFQSQEATG